MYHARLQASEKKVETLGKTSLTHFLRCKANVLFDKLPDRLEKKAFEALGT